MWNCRGSHWLQMGGEKGILVSYIPAMNLEFIKKHPSIHTSFVSCGGCWDWLITKIEPIPYPSFPETLGNSAAPPIRRQSVSPALFESRRGPRICFRWWTWPNSKLKCLAWTGWLLSSCPGRKNTSQPDPLAPCEQKTRRTDLSPAAAWGQPHLPCPNPAAPETFQKQPQTGLLQHEVWVFCYSALLWRELADRCYNAILVCFKKEKKSPTFQRYRLKYLPMKRSNSF